MKVWVQVQTSNSEEERTYEDVVRIDDSDKYKIFIYGKDGVLAVVNKSNLKNLLTEKD